MPDYGTDRLSLQNTTGAIQNNSGDPLLSTDDSGSSSYAFGAALSAGIYLGVQNGNIGAPPPNSELLSKTITSVLEPPVFITVFVLVSTTLAVFVTAVLPITKVPVLPVATLYAGRPLLLVTTVPVEFPVSVALFAAVIRFCVI